MRKGQAALEFLSTYGFAFIALFVVLGVISYTGVFNVSSLRSSDCRFSPGFLCQDYTFTLFNPNGVTVPGFATATPPFVPGGGATPYMRFIVTNSYGVNITVQQFNMTDDITNAVRTCHVVDAQNVAASPWQPAQNRTIYCQVLPAASFSPRQRYDGSVVIRFIQTGGAYSHTVRGHFSMVAR